MVYWKETQGIPQAQKFKKKIFSLVIDLQRIGSSISWQLFRFHNLALFQRGTNSQFYNNGKFPTKMLFLGHSDHILAKSKYFIFISTFYCILLYAIKWKWTSNFQVEKLKHFIRNVKMVVAKIAFFPPSWFFPSNCNSVELNPISWSVSVSVELHLLTEYDSMKISLISCNFKGFFLLFVPVVLQFLFCYGNLGKVYLNNECCFFSYSATRWSIA